MARAIVSADSLNYFDFEYPAGLARLTESEMALRPLKAWCPAGRLSGAFPRYFRKRTHCS